MLPKVVLCRHRLIFPGRFQPSIVSTDELNYRVRDGNGWTLIAKNTDYLNFSSRFLFSMTLSYHGDPYEIRTRVAGVRGRSLRPLDQRAISMVHHHGLEPWTPWLRVRCSTNWANGARLFTHLQNWTKTCFSKMSLDSVCLGRKDNIVLSNSVAMAQRSHPFPFRTR